MSLMTVISNILGVLSILSILCAIAVAILFTVDSYKDNSSDTEDEMRDKLEQEREYFRLMGVILYWATVATDEVDMEPTAREEVIEAIDTFDDLMIEDRIHII